MILFQILPLLLIQSCRSLGYDNLFTTDAHTALVTSVAFFNDQQRFITGAQDNKTKVWSTTNFTMLHEFTFADYVMNIALHPIDNRIFVLIYDGNIYVYDPDTYAQVHTFVFPGTAANYMVFEKFEQRFIMGGYEGSGLAPVLYFFNSTTYAQLSSITTGLPADDQINTISLNPDCTHVVINNLANITTTYQIEVYRLSNSALVNTFTDTTNKIKWTLFSPVDDFFCSTSLDMSIKCYEFSTATNQYVMRKNWYFNTAPYCMNFGFVDTLIVTVGTDIQFIQTQMDVPYKMLYYTIQDVASIYILAGTQDLGYLATGMGNGSISLWGFIPPLIPASNQINIEEQQRKQNTRNLAIGLGVGLGSLALLIIIGAALWFCGCCKRCRKRKNQNQEQSMNRLGAEQGIIVIKDDQHKSNGSSDIDYDELMAHGTVIIIKDEEKKRKYLEGIRRKQQKNNNNDNSELDNFLNVQGDIIIIRDDEHSEYRKKKKNMSDKSSDLDYEELMAEGNVIIIKDEETKKNFINKLKKKDKDNNTDYDPLMVEGNIIIIRGDQQQKIYLKQLNKQQDLKNIKHDQLFAEGDIIVIKDEEKKKQFTNKMKKQLQKNNQNPKDLANLQVAEQIIVICGDDDEDVTYEMLMAEGTVIVIKDDDTKKQYAKYLKKQAKKMDEKNHKGSQKSSNPDFDALMAEQCIIVIKDDDDKKNYANFVKYRREHSEKSSDMDLDDLKNGNIMVIKDKENKKRHNSAGNIVSTNTIQIKAQPNFQGMMAEKNVIVINQQFNQNQLYQSQLNQSYALNENPIKE